MKNTDQASGASEPVRGPSSSTRFPVGTVFMSGGRHPRTCTVEDMLTTTNLAGAVVRVRYVASHEFMGQIVRDNDVSSVAIAKGFVSFPAVASAAETADKTPAPSPVEEAEEKARRAFQAPAVPAASVARPAPSPGARADRRGAIRLG